MLQSLRLFKASPGVFIDQTTVNQENDLGFLPEISLTNYLYLAQPNPFNNIFIWNKVPNDVAANLKVEYWDGTNWRMMVDLLDETSVAGKTMARSGLVIFSPDPDHDWAIVDKSEKIAELNTVKIYDSYWLRISSSAAVNVLTELKEVSYCFAKSDLIDDLDLEVKQYQDEFEATKTEWIKELVMASKMVVMDLKRNNIVSNQGQLLKIEDVSLATAYRALMIIYRHLGRSFLDKMASAQKDYDKAMSFKSFVVDKNKNARVDYEEKEQRQNRLIR